MSESDRYDCPEPFCIEAFRTQELIAHLQWDHGYSEYKATMRVKQDCSIGTDSSSS